MSKQSQALASKNAAIRQINGGSTRRIVVSEDIRTTAAKNTSSVDNSAEVNEELEQDRTDDSRKTLWYAAGISLGFVLLLVLALKFKLIKF